MLAQCSKFCSVFEYFMTFRILNTAMNKYTHLTKVVLTRFETRTYGIHIKQETRVRPSSLTVSESNIGSFGSTALIAMASTTINTNVNSNIPTYHFVKDFFFEKNRNAINIHTSTKAPFMVISPKIIGAHNGL